MTCGGMRGGGRSIVITNIKGGRCQFKENLPKQGPQGPQKHSSLKSLNILNPPPILGIFTPAAIKNSFLSNSSLQNRKDRSTGSTNNGNMVKKAKRDVMTEGVCYNYMILEKLSSLKQ